MTQTKIYIARRKYDTTAPKRIQTKVRMLPKQAGIRKEKQAFLRYLGSHIVTTLAWKQRETIVMFE